MAVTSIGSPRTVYYVSAAAADDSGNGTTPSTPKKTIGAAKTLAAAGSLIVVGAGTYNERDLFKDGIEYLFELGAKVVYTGTAGAIFVDTAGAGVCVVRGLGQFQHSAASGGNRDILQVNNASTVIFEAISWQSTGRGLAGNGGNIFVKLEWASTADGTFDVLDSSCTAVVHCRSAVSDGFVVEMDGGQLDVTANRLESTGSNVVELAVGTIVMRGAEIIAPSGEVCLNASFGRVILHNCSFSTDEDPVAGSSSATVISMGSDLLASEVVGITAPVKRLNASTVDTLGVNAIASVVSGIDSDPPSVNLTTSSLSDIAGLATPGRSPNQDIPGATRWEVYEGETIEKVFSVYAADGVTKVSFTGKSLEIIFSTESDTVIATVPNGSITKSGDDDEIVTFAYPAAATLRSSVLEFTFREDTAPKRVYLQGTLTVKKAKFTAS